MESAQTQTRPEAKPSKPKRPACFVSDETIAEAKKHGVQIPEDALAFNVIFWASSWTHGNGASTSVAVGGYWAGTGTASGRVQSLSLLPQTGIVVALLKDGTGRTSFMVFGNWLSAEPVTLRSEP